MVEKQKEVRDSSKIDQREWDFSLQIKDEKVYVGAMHRETCAGFFIELETSLNNLVHITNVIKDADN